MLTRIYAEFPGASLWNLDTPEKSMRNRYFYEKHGYVKVGVKKHSEVLTLIEYEKKIEG